MPKIYHQTPYLLLQAFKPYLVTSEQQNISRTLVYLEAAVGLDLLKWVCGNFRAVGKREYLVIIRDNFCKFCSKTYVVTPHLNRLNETVQMRGYNIWFR